MEQKINIAELLKDCPQGMELDCTMFEGIEFDSIVNNDCFPILCRMKNSNDKYNFYSFTKYGYWNDDYRAKCVIFPKGKTTWEGFQRPFKEGDIVATERGAWIGIIRDKSYIGYFTYAAIYVDDGKFCTDGTFMFRRFATEEEKQKLFDAIKANGYRWNAETKTLDKIEIESHRTYKEFVHYLADKAVGDKREIIKAFDNNEHNRFIGYLQVTKRLINGKLFILFKVDGRELEAEWQASKNYGVWQERGWGGESYNGYLLFPTYKDNEYFVLWYKC